MRGLTWRMKGTDHNSGTCCASQQTACGLSGRAEEAGNMLVLPQDDANEEENRRQACRRESDCLNKYEKADDELACKTPSAHQVRSE